MISKPLGEDIPPYYMKYIDLCPEQDLLDALRASMNDTLGFLACIPAEKENFQYAEGKWTLKEVLNHIIDTERIFAYRALRFSRKDNTELAGYNENIFVPNSNTSERNLQDMAKEYKAVREATLALFEYMNGEMLEFKGTANKFKSSTKGIGWMIAGHNIHHCNVMREKYLD
jgi:uncharacterized damage-inducible protein DinB